MTAAAAIRTVPAEAPADLRLERLRSPTDLDAIRDEWDAFVERAGSDVYFTVDWVQAWWTHYGRGREFAGLVVRDGDALVGVLPFCVGRLWAGPVPVRLARLVGADSTLAVLTPPIAAGYEEPVLRAALHRLLDEDGCDAVSLSPLSGLSPAADAAERAASSEPFALVRSDTTGPHAVFELPTSFEAYLAGINRYSRRDHRRSLRHFNADHALSFRVVSGEEAIGHLDRFVDMHAAYWRTQGKLGHFGDWPASVDFNRDLLARMAATERARFYEISREGRVLAMEQCFVLGDRCHWRLAARGLDPELQENGIGRVSAVELFRVLIEDGRRIVEAGRGHYEYKVRLGAREPQLRRVVISRSSAASRRRAGLLLRFADLVNLVYYRAWFLKAAPRLRRIAPRLRLSRRPLSRVWTATRM